MSAAQRRELRARLDAALESLRQNGWTNRQLDAAFDGMLIEDMVEKAERYVADGFNTMVAA